MADMTNSKIVTRFPPSPTGWFHVGNARTALFNYFFTKQNNGKLLFRLEDTDKERSDQKYADDIIDGLKWLGIDIDYNHPYKQSEHSETYKKYIEMMLKNGSAYISKEEIKEEGQRAEVIRLKNPGKKVTYDDMIRGKIEVDTTELGDFIIAKSVSEPIYHLAAVVDDFEMGVTHILRGEDGIYNTPRQILIQEAIGAPRPIYAHLPFILNEDRSKLSKRKQGELVSLSYYRKQGYLPEAMVNFLAFCGWNPGDETELMSMDEIIQKFKIEKVQKSGAVFNVEKLKWINREYIKKMPPSEVLAIVSAKMPNITKDVLERALPSITDHISVFGDIDLLAKNGEFDYLNGVSDFPKEKLFWKGESALDATIEHLKYALEALKKLPEIPTSEQAKTALWDYATEKGRGQVLWPLRYALSGKDKSPDPFVLISILGTKTATERIRAAIKKLSS